MHTKHPSSLRPLPHRLLLLLTAGLAVPSARADEVWWIGDSGVWSDASAWSTGSVPGLAAPFDDAIRLGNVPGVSNHTVLLDHPPGGGAMVYSELHLSNGMTLDANHRELGTLTGSTVLSGPGSRLILRPSVGPNFHDLITFELDLGVGTQLELHPGSRASTGVLTSFGVISGRGTLHLQGTSDDGVSLVNNGTITGANNGGLLVVQEKTGRIDLDGTTGGGQLVLTAPFSVLTFDGDQLTDSFSGTLFMGSGALLNMNIANGWSADAGSTLNVSSSIVGAAAQIDGGVFTFGGDLNIGGSHGHLRLLADATLQPAADVFVGDDDRLEFDGDTTVEGGLYNLSEGARIDFDGPTQIAGGTFNMVGSTPSLGAVHFNAATTWSGTTTLNGYARQTGDATVSTPTTIHATVLDMDGSNSTTWTINQSLTVHTQAIEQGSQQFDGTLNLNAGAVGRLTVHLADPAAAWTMNGTMNLAGLGILTTTRIAGSAVVVTGDLNMGTGIAQITADATFQGATVGIAENGTLRMRGHTFVDNGTAFSGSGLLHNGLGGVMVFDSGTALSTVGLTSSGHFQIVEDGPGMAGVNRVTFTADSVWHVEIGGDAASDHDWLLVTGADGASIGGVLTVSLIDLGDAFLPEVGDEFTVLSSLLSGVSGTFSNDPVTHAGGLTYDWTVLYHPNRVVLRLDSIVPEPGVLALLGVVGGLGLRRVRLQRGTA